MAGNYGLRRGGLVVSGSYLSGTNVAPAQMMALSGGTNAATIPNYYQGVAVGDTPAVTYDFSGTIGSTKDDSSSANFFITGAFAGDGRGLTNIQAASLEAAGSDTQVQYNNGGTFGASANFTFGSSAVIVGASSATALKVTGALGVSGQTNLNGHVTLGDANTDNIVFTGEVSSSVVPNNDDAWDLGSSSQQWKDIYVDGIAYIDQLGTDGDESTAYIGGGEIDGTSIGSETPAASKFTTISGSSTLDMAGAITGNSGLTINAGTTAVQALTTTTIVASGIVKTDDTTEATSTTDGSLQTDGGLSVAKSAVIGDDLDLLSDSAIMNFGLNQDVTLTHVADTGLLLSGSQSNTKIQFNDATQYIGASSLVDLDLAATTDINMDCTTVDINAALDVSGSTTLNGAVTLGDATGDDITFTGRAASSIVPKTDSTYDLGSATLRFANVYTGDLHLRNERGDWTLYEESDHIKVRNNLTGKMFRMALVADE